MTIKSNTDNMSQVHPFIYLVSPYIVLTYGALLFMSGTAADAKNTRAKIILALFPPSTPFWETKEWKGWNINYNDIEVRVGMGIQFSGKALA